MAVVDEINAILADGTTTAEEKRGLIRRLKALRIREVIVNNIRQWITLSAGPPLHEAFMTSAMRTADGDLRVEFMARQAGQLVYGPDGTPVWIVLIRNPPIKVAGVENIAGAGRILLERAVSWPT